MFGESETDSENEEETQPEVGLGLKIDKEEADKNYSEAGTLVEEPKDEISLTKYKHLLNDAVHGMIMEVLEETKLPFNLSDFQLLSLHVLGSKQNLVLISPTGSGKMLGEYFCLNARNLVDFLTRVEQNCFLTLTLTPAKTEVLHN